MITNKLDLINEQTSPLFRIMWVNNIEDPLRRHFGNNICAFHIGNGLILTVAHNLRTESGYVNSFDESFFQSDIVPHLTPEQNNFLNHYYSKDTATSKRHANLSDQNNTKIVGEILKKINFDTRWLTLGEKNISKPFLIIQFRDNSFYKNEKFTKLFSPIHYFPEPNLNRHTFLIELKMVKAFYSDDIALYKIVNTDSEIIKNLPFISSDYSILDNSVSNFYCLQSSQSSFLGRLLNNAVIEGYSDNWSVFNDRIGGNYVMDGLRYLIKGYFRFGSSGAPYVFFDESSQQFKVNAIQSEASPIQLSINNNRDGNYQYVNAIASPLKNIREEIESLFIQNS